MEHVSATLDLIRDDLQTKPHESLCFFWTVPVLQLIGRWTYIIGNIWTIDMILAVQAPDIRIWRFHGYCIWSSLLLIQLDLLVWYIFCTYCSSSSEIRLLFSCFLICSKFWFSSIMYLIFWFMFHSLGFSVLVYESRLFFLFLFPSLCFSVFLSGLLFLVLCFLLATLNFLVFLSCFSCFSSSFEVPIFLLLVS